MPFNVETGYQGITMTLKQEYWISGVKKRDSNRHWAGHGKIMLDRRAVPELLEIIGEHTLPGLFEVIDIEDRFPVERVSAILNEKKE